MFGNANALCKIREHPRNSLPKKKKKKHPCVGIFAHVFLHLHEFVHVRVRKSGKGKGSVSEGSGLTAGYNRDTLNSHLIRLTGGEQ